MSSPPPADARPPEKGSFLLSPAVALMNRLPYSGKFALISLLFALPLGVVLTQFVFEMEGLVRFTRKEQAGVAYLRPLRQLLDDMLTSRDLARRESSQGATLAPSLARQQARIEADLQGLLRVDQQQGSLLDTGSRATDLAEQGGALQQRPSRPGDLDRRHAELLAAAGELINHVGNSSNLILDPDLDSYYLMDLVLLKLPQRQRLVAEHRLLVRDALARGSLTVADRAQIVHFDGLLDHNLQEAERGLAIVRERTRSPQLRPRLEPVAAEAAGEARRLLHTLTAELLAGSSPRLTPEEYDRATARCLDAGFRLWDQAADELDELLQVRLAGLRRREGWTLAIAAGALALVAYLWLGFYASVARTVATLRERTQRMVAGPIGDETLSVATRDELGAVVHLFNDLLGRLRTEWKMARDESARAREAEAATREAESRYRDLFTNATEGIFQTAPDGRLLSVNPALAQLYGCDTPEQLLTHSEDCYVIPGRRRELYARLQAEDRVSDFESQVRRRDGSVIWISENAHAVRDAAGRLRYYEGMVLDVTPRKRAEDRIRAVLETAPHAILMTDVSGTIVLANAHMEELLGYRREELLGQSVELLVPPVFHAVHRRHVEGFFALVQDRPMRAGREVVARHKNGRLVPVEIGLAGLRTEEGSFAIASLTDLTMQKEAAARLEAARRAAEEANRAKSEFLANMSHEIRTPMNGILGMTELLMNTRLGAEQREYLGLVKGSADSLLRILNDILDFSKIEAGKLELEACDFSLRDCVGRTGQTLTVRAAARNLELACRIDPAVPDGLVGDAGRLRQILVNLIGNAIKFTERGEVAVDVTLEPEPATPERVFLHFRVRDTGIGIAAEKQAHIFDAFAQADSSTTRKYGGTGLGLSISAQLVRLMNGRIWLESAVGRGTTFHFTAEFGRGTQAAPTVPVELSSLAGLPVLIVDDNATNRLILQEMLLGWKFRPEAVSSGVEALTELARAAVAGHPYRLVLLDCMMPEMDGFMLAERITREPTAVRPLLIMVSSAVQPGDAERCRQMGIIRYLVKPFVASEMLDSIVAALNERQPSPRSPAAPAAPTAPAARSLRILLAEDNPVNQRVAQGLLRAAGHSVEVANNGREAVAAVQRRTFDVVLMDMQMPEMDGLEATATIRAVEQQTGGHLPILAMTAAAMKGDRERCLAAGMDGYLSKPVDPRQLYQLLNHVAGQPPARRTPPINLDHARRHLPDGEESLREFARLLADETPNMVGQLRTALDSGDSAAVQRSGHTIKGTFQLFAAAGVIELGRQIELLGHAGRLDEARALLPQLEEQTYRVIAALNHVAANGSLE